MFGTNGALHVRMMCDAIGARHGKTFKLATPMNRSVGWDKSISISLNSLSMPGQQKKDRGLKKERPRPGVRV